MRGLWGTSALAVVLSAGAVMGVANAQTLTDERQYAEADTSEYVTVTATRTPQATDDVPNTVSVIGQDEIEESLATDIKDLIRFEPGVSVHNAPTRISAGGGTGRDGNAGFNIRGLEGNRVLITVDGVRVPDSFEFGGPVVFGRGDYVDLGLVSSVEILRGPASALYGSDGLAGAVSFITADPSDFLGSDDNFGARLRASYASADDSWSESLSAAGRWGDWSALVAYTRRDGHEQENQGDNEALNSTRTVPNRQEVENNAALARLVFEPSDAHRFRLTVDHNDRDITTEVLSARSATVLDFDTHDDSNRDRASFDYTYTNDGGAIDRAFFSAYYQTSEINEFHFEDRTTTDRIRISTFENDVAGVSGQLESKFSTGAIDHHFTYGGDYSLTRQEGLRDGTFPSGEIFPTRAFPNTDYTLAGVYVQDEITLLNGSLSVFPAIRYDQYEIDPEDDALYTLPIAGSDDSRVTPRLGIVAWPTEHFGAFFNYAEGFRAPSPTQVNQAFTSFTLNYTTIPNPDLQAETSQTFEAGIRFRDIGAFGGTWRASATAFAGDYDDFIEQVQISGPPFGAGTPGDLTTFQFINLTSATISGYEGRIDGSWENGFGVIAALSFAEGEQVEDGVRSPLESIDPFKLVAGLTYDDPGGRFGGQLIATHAERKHEDDTAAGNFRPDAFTVLDLTAYWNITDAATLRVGAFNVTDETYWWWSDVRGNLASSATLDAFTQPGANYSASISYRF